jgi:hypothetical protein
MKDKVKFILSQKLMVFLKSPPFPPWMLILFIYLFLAGFWKISPCLWSNSVLWFYIYLLFYKYFLSYTFNDHTFLQIHIDWIVGDCFDRGFFFAMSHLIGLSPKTLWNPSFPIKKKTLFYIYTILHDHIKSYKMYWFLHLHCFTQLKINLHSFTLTTRFVFYIYTYTNINGY